MNLSERRTIRERRDRVDACLGKLSAINDQIKTERKLLKTAQKKLTDLEQAQEIAQQVAEKCQQKASNKLSEIVSHCLQTVCPNPYEFKIQFEQKRGRTEAVLTLCRDGIEVTDPLNEAGGGIVDIAALALRIGCLMLSRPHSRRLLILDEPFRMVHEDLKPLVRTLLETLSEEMGIQIVMVAHDSEFQAGKVVRLS